MATREIINTVTDQAKTYAHRRALPASIITGIATGTVAALSGGDIFTNELFMLSGIIVGGVSTYFIAKKNYLKKYGELLRKEI